MQEIFFMLKIFTDLLIKIYNQNLILQYIS